MKKINEILEASNFWNKDLFIGNPRSQHINEILELLKLNKCVVLSGPRYSGKSIIVRQVFKTLIDSGVPNVNFLHINLEDPRLEKPLTTKVIFEIIKSYEAKLNPKGEIYITLDEIQSFPDWQKFTKTILQRSTSYKLILTTSSMLDSSRFFEKNQDKFSEHKIGPLSFMEFLDWKEVKSFHATENELTEYLKFGGFPKVVLESNLDIKEEILLGYYQRTIERDLALAFGIRSYNDINRLIDFVMSHTSESISTYEIEKTLKILNVTARNFIKNLKDCHLVSELSFFSESAKQRIYNPEKLFICDTGFVNIMSDQVSNLSVARSAIFEKNPRREKICEL